MTEHDHGVRQEPDSIQTGRVVTIGLIAFVTFAVGIAWAVSVQRGQTGTIRSNTAPAPAFVGRTEIGMVYQPLFDRGRGIAAERDVAAHQQLDSYGLVGADKQTAHIPISRAMELVIERGKL